mgnify:CR=1 FL=1
MHPILNDEQILELCQMAIVQDESRFEGYAGEFLTYYAMKDSPEGISDAELHNKVTMLMAEGIGNSLVKKGLLQYSLESDNGLELIDDYDGDTEM